jgi:catechol 2,3-dioxygenase-like lactoylglutathione lyase family enzyme
MTAAKTHLSLNVADVERSTAWYEKFFGEPAHKVRKGYANFDIDNPALKLALNESKSFGAGALNHLGILVDTREEVEAAKERLEKAGLVESVEVEEVCCHARQTKFWAKDPDGNMWEVYTIVDDMLEDEGAGESSCCGSGTSVTVCCDGDADKAAACCK